MNSDLPRTRAVAKAQNAAHYFNGLPCPKGHIAFRFTSSGRCAECTTLGRVVYDASLAGRARLKSYNASPQAKARKASYKKSYTGQRAGKHERLSRKYAMSIDDFEAMWADQGGVCITCSTSLDDVKACVDHDHDTGRVRGILCHNCNVSAGLLKDSPRIAASLSEYLRGHSAIREIEAFDVAPSF